MLVHHLLEEAAQQTPDATSVIEPARSIAYGDLDTLAGRFACVLQSEGVAPGDRVILALENSITLVAAYFGVLKAGAIAVPLPHGPRSDRLVAALTDCSPTACVVDRTAARDLAASEKLTQATTVLVQASGGRPPDLGPNQRVIDLDPAVASAPSRERPAARIDLDLASIIYTSGSTGAPRGVMLRHRNILANTRSIVSYLNLTPADRAMCVLPLYYVYGLSILHTHVMAAGSVVLDNRFMYPSVVVNAMREHRVTGFAGVPSTFALLLSRSNVTEIELPSLRYVTQAGGGMPPARILEWLERGPKVPFYVMYGATEASARLTYLLPAELQRKLGSIGKAIPNTEVLVIRDDGEYAGAGEVGELIARGANVACGYWNNAEETSDKFDARGYRTGDLGYRDDDGFLFLVGRRHDMIKVGAHRIGATEIEDVLHEHPAIQEAAVVAAPHDILGEVPVAFVVTRQAESMSGDAIRAFCAAHLAAHKVPAAVSFLKELPKSGVGKIDRLALKALAARVRRENSACEA